MENYGEYINITSTASKTLPCLIESLRIREGGEKGKLLISSRELCDVLYYLERLKTINEEPPLGKKPDYISLDFFDLAKMIGEPVFFYPEGLYGLVRNVERDKDGDFAVISTSERNYHIWIADNIYRTKEGAKESIRIKKRAERK